VRFAKPTASRTMDNYSEAEKKMKELKWKKEKTLEDIKREQVLREHAVFNFGKKKEEFVRCLAQSSCTNQVLKLVFMYLLTLLFYHSICLLKHIMKLSI